MRTAVHLLTPDVPRGGLETWNSWRDWFIALLPPASATWHRCCIGLADDKPEPHINVTVNGWRVQQVGSWYEISSGRTLVITPQWEQFPLRRVVAILRLVGALPAVQP